MLSPSAFVPSTDAPPGTPRPGAPLDSGQGGMAAGQMADVLTGQDVPRERHNHQTVPASAVPLVPAPNATGKANPRPRSMAEISLDSSTSLQRHFHHQRHQSGSDLRPSTSSHSPTTSSQDGLRVVDMPLTGDNRGGQSPASRGILSSWLPASPAETARSIRARSETLSPGTTPTKAAPGQRAQQHTTPTPKNTASPGTSRFAFISSSLTALTKGAQPRTPNRGSAIDDDGDELANLDIDEALFPASPSSPTTRDPFSPAAYKNLEQSASALLSTFQTAYRRQREELRDLRMERAAKDDELEETDMRTRHLKMQLEDLARQAAEREQEMQGLLAALDKERRMNRESLAPSSDSVTVVSEDLGAEEDQARGGGWRKSGHMAFEDTDEESESVGEAPSVFSRSRSPTFAPAAKGGVPQMQQQQQQQQPMNAFRKLVKGFTGEGEGAAACGNCRGQESQVAWDTVASLRDENRGLKTRVAELEKCVEGALDAVNGLRI